MKRIKFNSMKKEEILGRLKNKFIVLNEFVLFLIRGGKINWIGGYLRLILLCFNWKFLVYN